MTSDTRDPAHSPYAPARYAPVRLWLHWVMLALIAAVYASIELRELFPRGSDERDAMKAWHFMLGASVLFLAVGRLFARIVWPAPPITPRPPVWQRVPALAVHAALYLLMIGVPLAGWLMVNAAGGRVPFFGLELPALIGQDRALAGNIKQAHVTVATLGYWLIGLHAAAALFHHYVVRDNTLRRMLPGRR